MMVIVLYQAPTGYDLGHWLRLTAEYALDREELESLRRELEAANITYVRGLTEPTSRNPNGKPWLEIRMADPQATAPAATGERTITAGRQS